MELNYFKFLIKLIIIVELNQKLKHKIILKLIILFKKINKKKSNLKLVNLHNKYLILPKTILITLKIKLLHNKKRKNNKEKTLLKNFSFIIKLKKINNYSVHKIPNTQINMI